MVEQTETQAGGKSGVCAVCGKVLYDGIEKKNGIHTFCYNCG